MFVITFLSHVLGPNSISLGRCKDEQQQGLSDATDAVLQVPDSWCKEAGRSWRLRTSSRHVPLQCVLPEPYDGSTFSIHIEEEVRRIRLSQPSLRFPPGQPTISTGRLQPGQTNPIPECQGLEGRAPETGMMAVNTNKIP